jgi:S-formylglutathione hydrolase FrmB
MKVLNAPTLCYTCCMAEEMTKQVGCNLGKYSTLPIQAIKEGKATAMIIVMPDANTGRRGYFNDVNNEWRYEDFFFEELMPEVEKKYRIKSEKRYRAIAGLSMGGGGSFFYAMHRPDLFSSACPLSAAVRNNTFEEFKQGLETQKVTVKNTNSLTAYYDRHQALRQIELNDAEAMKSVKWYFDCGDDDFLYEGNSLVHIAMKKKEIPTSSESGMVPIIGPIGGNLCRRFWDLFQRLFIRSREVILKFGY